MKTTFRDCVCGPTPTINLRIKHVVKDDAISTLRRKWLIMNELQGEPLPINANTQILNSGANTLAPKAGFCEIQTDDRSRTYFIGNFFGKGYHEFVAAVEAAINVAKQRAPAPSQTLDTSKNPLLIPN